MIGLKKYTHADRQKAIEALLPDIRNHFGDNLVALAATASFARGEDADYSDLEMTAIVREMPEGEEIGGTGRVIDGLLVELIWMTEETYVRLFKRTAHDDWYLAASDRMVPVLNPGLVTRLNDFPVEVGTDALAAQLRRHWGEVQESTGKALKALLREDRDALALVYWDMVRHMLIALSLMNATPYTTRARMVSEARGFAVLPSTFEQLVAPLLDGFADPSSLAGTVSRTFEEMEGFLSDRGIHPYATEWRLFDDARPSA